MVASPERGTVRPTCEISPVMTIVVLKRRRVRDVLHLLFGGVLSLVEDHETAFAERAAAHVGERRHFDGAVVHVPLELAGAEHVGQARRTAGAGTGRPCR